MIEATASVLWGYLVVGLLCVAVNLGILALNLKLYTEYFKDRSAEGRGK